SLTDTDLTGDLLTILTSGNDLTGDEFHAVSWSGDWTGEVVYGDGYVQLKNMVPEPATLAMLGIGGCLALRRRRSRTCRAV
ncbi:hypothetical protein LCGC14_2804580, partial [marine sediment metagenome]